MGLVSRYVDPETGHYVIEDGNYKRTSASLFSVYGLLMAKADSIPASVNHICKLRNITHLVPGAARDVEQAIDEVLKPHVGTLFSRYTRKAYINTGGALVFEVAIYREDGTLEQWTVPVAG